MKIMPPSPAGRRTIHHASFRPAKFDAGSAAAHALPYPPRALQPRFATREPDISVAIRRHGGIMRKTVVSGTDRRFWTHLL